MHLIMYTNKSRMKYYDDTLVKKSSIAMEVKKKIRIKSSNLANHIDIKINSNYKVYKE